MNEIKVTGKQEFMGSDIPVVLGGFGEGKKCISDKTIAEIHGVKVFHVRELIGNNIKRFTAGVDYIDMKKRIGTDDTLCEERSNEITTLELLLSLGYAKQSITQAEHIYILSERGYAKLIKIMDTNLAWQIHDRLIDEYFDLREQHKKLSQEEMMRIQLGMLDKQGERLDGVEERVDHLENTMTVDYEQSQILQKTAKCRALDIVGGKDSRAYTYQYPSKGFNDKPQMLFKKLMSRLWHDYQDYFKVNSRNNTPTVRFEEACRYLESWEPPINLKLDIEKINAESLDDILL